MISTLTSKGQITLPKPIRDHLKIKAGDKIDFVVDDKGEVHVLPVFASVRKLKGMVPKPKRKVSLKDMRDAIDREGGCL